MFFFFSKVLSFVFAPVSWLTIFILPAAFSKNPVKRKKLILASLFILLFFSNTFIFDRFMHAWEVPAIRESEIPETEIGILLTGMSTYDPTIDRVEFNDRNDRLMQCLQLYHSGKIHKILLCGGPASILENDTIEFFKLRDYLVHSGIPDSAIFLEYKSRNTHENALFAKPFVEKYSSGKSALLITSGYHLRRAIGCFAKEGMQVIPYATDRYSGPVKFELDYLLLPSAQTLFNWEKLIHEWVGSLSYGIAGYL